MNGHGGLRPGAGRPKGSLNKDNRDIREMILAALVTVGGKDYLARQAEQNPSAFLGLVGKVLPTQITSENGAALNWVIRIPAEPSSAEEWFLQYAPKHIQDARKAVAGETINGEAKDVTPQEPDSK